MSKFENILELEQLPLTGWECTDVHDLGSPVGSCEKCGTTIRFEHQMCHPNVNRQVVVGCDCAIYMAEAELHGWTDEYIRKLVMRRQGFLKRKWMRNPLGEYYANWKKLRIAVFSDGDLFGFAITSRFLDTWISEKRYLTRELAIIGLCDATYELLEHELFGVSGQQSIMISKTQYKPTPRHFS